MQSVVRSVWLMAASKDISLVYEHVPGTDNCIADVVSSVFEGNLNNLDRFQQVTCWPVHGLVFYPNMVVYL